MHQAQDTLQHESCRRAGFRLCSGILARKQGLGKFQVPIAKRAPDELIQSARRLVKAIGFDRRRDRIAGASQFAQNPAIDCFFC